MTDSLKIISSWLLVTNVCVDTGITSGTCQILSFPEGDVLSIRVLIALSQTEINNKDVILVILISTNQEVIWLNISVDNSLFVNFLNTLNLQ